MKKELLLNDNISLTKNGLGVFLENEKALVIADLHIGLEYALMGEGTYLPVLQYPTIEKSILEMVKEYTPENLIINGDFKHEFSKTTHQEWNEILNLWDALKNEGVELTLVRGNHDNYLINILKQRNKTISDPSLKIGRVMIAHGHKPFEIDLDVKTIILAHEHPALLFIDEAGGKHKFKCYLHGNYDGHDILILPAYSPLAPGIPVNGHKTKRFMSPWLREIGTSDFKPLIVDNEDLLTFPQLKDLDAVGDHYEWYDRLELMENEK